MLARATRAICFVDLPHRPAGADDPRKVVALPELFAQVGILIDEPLPLGVDQPLHAHRLPDHRRHQPQHPHQMVVVPVALERQIQRQRPHRSPVDGDRHADETDLALVELAARQPVAEHRLAADLRHDHRLVALDDLGRDAFGQAIPRARPIRRHAVGGVHVQVAGRVDHRDGATHEAVLAPEDLEHPHERGLERQRARQRPD